MILILLLVNNPGQTSGLRQSWGPNGETSGKRNFSVGLVHVRERHGMYHLTATVSSFFFFFFFFFKIPLFDYVCNLA